MDEREKQEEKNKRIGWLTSLGVQLVLLVLFYFIVAWKEPFPPIPEYGIELGFTTSAGAPSTSTLSKTAPETEEPTDDVEESNQTEEPAVESSEENVVNEQPVTPSKVESPVKVEESKTETKEPVEEVKEEVDSRAVMNPSDTDSDKSTNNPSEGEEEKEIDQRAIYGSQGTNTGNAEGATYDISGWKWVSPPQPNDKSGETGEIVFDIVLDQNGEVISAKARPTNISPLVLIKYRDAIFNLSFTKTSENKSAERSVGTITFIIKSR